MKNVEDVALQILAANLANVAWGVEENSVLIKKAFEMAEEFLKYKGEKKTDENSKHK